MSCDNGIVIPTLSTDKCGGKKMYDECIIHEQAITFLDLPANSSIKDVIDKLILIISGQNTRIQSLENQIANHTTRIQNLEP